MKVETLVIKSEKKSYIPPKLVSYGNVRALTQGGSGQSAEGSMDQDFTRRPQMSDRLLKDSIVKIGLHPLGISLYLFDYKPEFRDAWGHGRQFGVMADEVEQVMPEAVSVHPGGYKMVNYAMLGISRNLH